MERVEPEDKYFTCLESMQCKFDKFARRYPVNTDSIEAYKLWAATARGNLENLLGLDKMEDCDLNAKLLETTELEGKMRREKMIIQVEPDVYMPFYIIYPSKDVQKYIGNENNKKPACMIAPHDYQVGGKEATAGCSEIPAIRDVITKYHYDYGLQLAKKGYIAICPDARGFGERREQAFHMEGESYPEGTCHALAHMAEPLGMTVMGMFVWDLMRLVDYVYERDDWDVTELGFVGFSGGGMQTLYTAALDERIQKAIISGHFYGFKDSLLLWKDSCNCNEVPHLWEYYDCGDIEALLCPRQVFIQSCKEDPSHGPRGFDNVLEQLEIMNKAYTLFQAQDNIKVDLRDGDHCFHPEILGII